MKRNAKIPSRHALLYFLLMGSAAVLAVAKYAIFARVLEPEDFGLYNLVLTTYVFIVYAGGLGLNEGLIKLGAQAKGTGNIDAIYQLRDISIVVGGVTTVLLGTVFWGGVQLFVHDATTVAVLWLAAPMGVAVVAYNLIDSSLRANQQLLHFSSMLLLKAIILLVLGYYLAPRWGSSGVVLAEILSFSVVFLLFLFLGGRAFNPRNIVNGAGLLRKAIHHGFPMLASMFIRNVCLALDRWVIAISLGLLAIGKYAFAMIIYLVALTGLGFLTNLLGPRWLAQYALDGDVHMLYRRILSVAVALFLLALVLAGPFFWAAQNLLPTYYPKYAGPDTIWTMVFIYIGVVVLVCSCLFDWLFVATSNEISLLRISAVALIITAFAMATAYTANVEIVGYAAIFLAIRIATALMYATSVQAIVTRDSHPEQ